MERCKFCSEVLESDFKYCPYCGKDVNKKPSKKFLKKQEKEKNFVVNNDARLYRVSYRIFGVLFFIVGLLAMALYGQYFLGFALEKPEWATKLTDIVNKAGKISDRMNKWVPYEIVMADCLEKEYTFVLIICACALVLTLLSLFTRKFSWGAFFYKLSALFGTLYFAVRYIGTVPFEVPEAILKFIEENYKMLTYIGAGASVGFFVLGLLFSFSIRNPYRPTLYQGFKALYWGTLSAVALIGVLSEKLELSEKIMETVGKVSTYTLTLMPAYIFVGALLLFIGAKYRGKIERLK